MKAIPKIENDEFIRVQYAFDKYEPIIEHRTIQKTQVGSWLFGLLPVYKYFYSDWKAK